MSRLRSEVHQIQWPNTWDDSRRRRHWDSTSRWTESEKCCEMHRKPFHQHVSGTGRTVYSLNVSIVTCVLPTGRNHQRERKRRTTVGFDIYVSTLNVIERHLQLAHWTQPPERTKKAYNGRVRHLRQHVERNRASPATCRRRNHQRNHPCAHQ